MTTRFNRRGRPKRGRPKKARRLLSDADYLAAKERSALNKEKGDTFEQFVLMFYVVHAAALYVRGVSSLAQDATVHLYSGEFVDDIKFSTASMKRTRYVHAKSGAKARWDENLVRDFRSQSLRGTGESVELWVSSDAIRKKMIASRPTEVGDVTVYCLRFDWQSRRAWASRSIVKHLRCLVWQCSSGLAMEDGWYRILEARRRLGRRSTVFEILRQAHSDSKGGVRSLADPNADLVNFVSRLGQVEGLHVAADGDTLLVWGTDLNARYGDDIRRIPWTFMQSRLTTRGHPVSKADFFSILGAM